MADTLREVLVYRSTYKEETNPSVLKEYIYACNAMGSVAALFENPAIPTLFYTSMKDAADAIGTAQNVYNLAPTKGNLGLIKLRMDDGVIVLDSYADQVEVIANASDNRSTREGASVNIKLSYLTPYKLDATPKGKPDQPVMVGSHVTLGEVAFEVTNHGDTAPTQTTFILVQLPPVTDPVTPDPVVSIVNGMPKVVFSGPGEMFTQTLVGWGKHTSFKNLIFGGKYKGYAVSQNGKKQVSDLSLGVPVQS